MTCRHILFQEEGCTPACECGERWYCGQLTEPGAEFCAEHMVVAIASEVWRAQRQRDLERAKAMGADI